MENKKVKKYAYVLIERHLCRINLTQLCENTPPELEVMVDFQKQGLPVGMGGFFLNSKLYLTGGENIPRDEISYRPRLVPEENSLTAYNTDVYLFDPPNSCIIQNQIPPLLASKTNPKIAVVDDKVYILRDRPFYLRGLEVSPPSFECYDPNKNLWEELPPHPGHERVGLCYFNVMNRKIHIRNASGVWLFYDVDLRKWFYAADEGFLEPYRIRDVIYPFYCHCLVAECENGLVISYTHKGLVAYLYGDDGTIKFQRRLDEVNDKFKAPKFSLGFVKDLGEEGKFCYIYSSPGSKFSWSIAVSIIQVEIQAQAGDLNVVATLLHGPLEYDTHSMFDALCSVTDVFIVCEDSKKRGAESVDIDKSFKKHGLIS